MKSIYTFYKERLIEISGKNRSLYLKNFTKKNGYDIGKILFHNHALADEFLETIWAGKTIPFRIIGKETKDEILKANNFDLKNNLPEDATEKERQKFERKQKENAKKLVEQEVKNFVALKREIEEIEKETGRYELFLCYPFVYGTIRNYTFKAPLLMFPIDIDILDDSNVNISLRQGENVQLNKALMFAFADSYRLNLEDMDMEFDCLKSKFADIPSLLRYLREFGIKISCEERKDIFAFNRYPEPSALESPEVKYLCLISRCSLANSIYADYSALEKKHLTNDSINELLNTKTIKHKNVKTQKIYLINNVDYAQEQVVRQVNESGNMVIYGPPGTGKSQTIVNVIADAICKNKKVLVVSQKKAALEVVYNRLGVLNRKAMFITDAEKEKRSFCERCLDMHNNLMETPTILKDLQKQYDDVEKQLDAEVEKLNTISNCLTQKTPFGISLQEMYYNSYKIGKKSVEYSIYQKVLKTKKLLAMNYNELYDALSILGEGNKAQLYYDFVESKKKNPFIDHLKTDLEVHTIAEAETKLKNLSRTRQSLFDVAKYKYSRQILTYYTEIKAKKNLTPLIKMIAKLEYPQEEKQLKASYVLFPMYPFAKAKMNNIEKQIGEEFSKTVEAMDEYLAEYDFLKYILTPNGYLMAVDGILNGNNDIIKLLLNAVENYIELRDINLTLKNLTDDQKLVLNFAYKNATSYSKYIEVLQKLLPLRIYHEILTYEKEQKNVLSSIVDFENIRSRIVTLKNEQNMISKQIAFQNFVDDYKILMSGRSIKSKDFLYQISKKQNFWPIRKMIDIYGSYLFKMFPCWLLSPENVSTILPLKKNMFDIVLFDEASQVFIENTIPSIYRGNRIVVAGDAKQLRPTTTFMKRYMGGNVDDDIDLSTQAALEVESLLDLSVARFNSANITYHYRSQNEELIDFSNKAFYNGKLQIAPNISKNLRHKPIERILVDGKWNDRKNLVEAQAIVDLTKKILNTRKHNETIGIITFNVEQEATIEDMFDKECFKDATFRTQYIRETSRNENGEDISLFVKNLENVQGDERDIIIFSIGYARNEFGKVNASFGSLSNEGGENRLNVAITRAKKKIYVVTSIEPEELRVENSKFVGPKLLRSYLTYARAVSNGNSEECKSILESFDDTPSLHNKSIGVLPLENQIQQKLIKLGYYAEVNLGNSGSKISVAVYDKKKDKYLLGIETDQTAIQSSNSVMERDIYRNEFLKSRGWRIFRVWSRDWWHNASNVMNSIVKEIEKQKKLLDSTKGNKALKKNDK